MRVNFRNFQIKITFALVFNDAIVHTASLKTIKEAQEQKNANAPHVKPHIYTEATFDFQHSSNATAIRYTLRILNALNTQ